MDIPLNTPICLKAHTGNNLQNQFVWQSGRCNNQNTQAWEQMKLIQTADRRLLFNLDGMGEIYKFKNLDYASLLITSKSYGKSLKWNPTRMAKCISSAVIPEM
jgi:hypothetical protein